MIGDWWMLFTCPLFIVLTCYIGYHRKYYSMKLRHWNYRCYPVMYPIHRLRNLIHFKMHGKYSNVINTKTESIAMKQNDDLNQEFDAKLDNCVRFVCISDTHELHKTLHIPKGDVLIHCGDVLFANFHKFSLETSIQKMQEFNEWLGSLEFRYKIIVAGNHDYVFEKIGKKQCKKILCNGIYLENESLELLFNGNHASIKLHGSPASIPNSAFSTNRAFQFERDEIGEKIWSKIPNDVDILITHHMPFGYLCKGKGCKDLLEIIKSRCTRCQFHIFGYWHGEYGVKFGMEQGKDFKNENRENVCFMNASSVDDFVCPMNPSLVFDYPL